MPYEFHTGAVPEVLIKNYHEVLTITNTMGDYSYHPERSGHTADTSSSFYFTLPLAFSVHYNYNYSRALSE